MAGMDAQHLRQFVTSLERTDRLILTLHYAEQLTTIEVSMVLDIAESTVINTLERLRAKVARMLTAAARHPAAGVA